MFTPDTTVLLQMEVLLMKTSAFLQRAHCAVRCTILNAAPTAFVPDDAMKQLDTLIVNEGEGAAITAQAGLTASS